MCNYPKITYCPVAGDLEDVNSEWVLDRISWLVNRSHPDTNWLNVSFSVDVQYPRELDHEGNPVPGYAQVVMIEERGFEK